MSGRVLNPIEIPRKTESPLFTKGEGMNMFGAGANKLKKQPKNANMTVFIIFQQ